jgi:hypothetical protein
VARSRRRRLRHPPATRAAAVPDSLERVAGVGSQRPRPDVARFELAELKNALRVVVPRFRPAPKARPQRLTRLGAGGCIERHVLTIDPEIVEIDVEAGNCPDGHYAVETPKARPRSKCAPK